MMLPSQLQATHLYLSSIRREPDESRRVAEQRVLRASLQRIYGTDTLLSYTAEGAPLLQSRPQEYISISHSEDFLLLGLAPFPIGIDIETLGCQVERVVRKFTVEQELLLLPKEELHLHLHLLWSAKEAAYKLRNPPDCSLKSFVLNRFKCDSETRLARMELYSLHTSPVFVHLCWTNTYVIALAHRIDVYDDMQS